MVLQGVVRLPLSRLRLSRWLSKRPDIGHFVVRSSLLTADTIFSGAVRPLLTDAVSGVWFPFWRPGIAWLKYARQMPVALTNTSRCTARPDQTASQAAHGQGG